MTLSNRTTITLCSILLLVSSMASLDAQSDDSSGNTTPRFLQKATKRAVNRIQNAVVNVRPKLNWGMIPSYDKLLKKRAGDRLKSFVNNVEEEGLMNDRHKRALRILLHRLDGKQMYSAFRKKLTRVMSRGPTRIRDALDFLQYMAPPETGFSGLLLRDGYVLTSRFAVSNDQIKNIYVHTAGDQKLAATKKGSYGRFDVALLEIKNESSLPENVQPVSLTALKDTIKVGDWAIAVGRGPRPEEITASRGIVSANRLLVGRSIQTDAFGNYSNTGGALVDIRGRLIGVITGVTLDSVLMVGQNSGVTKAVRPGALKQILPDLKKGKEIRRSFLGVKRAGESKPGVGVRIDEVLEGCAAANAGLKDGDVILSFGGKEIQKWRDLVNQIRGRLPGDSVQLKIRRNGSTKTVQVQLTSRKCHK